MNSKKASTKNNKGQSKQLVSAPIVPGNPININDLAKAIKKLEDDDEDLIEGSDSSFTTKILKVHLPRRMKGNFILRYDRTTDLRAHIHDFV